MDLARIMTAEPLTVAPSARPADAARLMDERGVRHLPVVEEGKLLGLLSDRELLSGPAATSVRELMQSPPATALPSDSPAALTAELALRAQGCVLVALHGALLGIVSELDLLAAYVRACREGRLRVREDPPVEDRMSAPFESLELGATLGEAAELMASLRIRHLPVLDGGHPIGMLSDRDLRRALGRGAAPAEEIDAHLSRPALCIEAGTHLSSAAERMSERKLGALPVLRGTHAIGLLTLSDLVDHVLHELRLGAL